MRHVVLNAEGFENVVLWENGMIELPNGRKIEEPYATGQVSLPLAKGFGNRTANLGRLVAKYFVPNPEGHKSIDYLDGNRMNCAAGNIIWVGKRPRATSGQMQERRAVVIQMHVQGCSKDLIVQETGININTLNQILAEFEADVAAAP